MPTNSSDRKEREIVFVRLPRKPIDHWMVLNKVPPTQSFQSFSVHGKTPSSTKVEQIIVYNVTINLCQLNHLWDTTAI